MNDNVKFVLILIVFVLGLSVGSGTLISATINPKIEISTDNSSDFKSITAYQYNYKRMFIEEQVSIEYQLQEIVVIGIKSQINVNRTKQKVKILYDDVDHQQNTTNNVDVCQNDISTNIQYLTVIDSPSMLIRKGSNQMSNFYN